MGSGQIQKEGECVICEPSTLTALALGATVLGGVQQAQASRDFARAESAAANQNARLAEAQAQDATRRGLVEEDRRRALLRQQLGAQRAAMAASNVDMATGTPLELLGDTAAAGEQDVLTIRANAAREAWGYRAQGANFANQANMARAAGRNAVTSSILTTAGSAAGMGAGLFAPRAPGTFAPGTTFGTTRYGG